MNISTHIIFILSLSLTSPKLFTTIINLRLFEKTVYSQFGEDGIIKKFFSLVEPATKYCVEFGAGDGYTISNTLNLRRHYGWNALLMEANHEDLSINLHKEFITAENINELFNKYHVPENFDLLSIDVDSIDFYLWYALDEKYKPALVIIEYNRALGLEDKVIAYNPQAQWDGTNYYGASVTALCLLAQKKGYSLVHINPANCFFVRNDIIEKLKNFGIYFLHTNNAPLLLRPEIPNFPPDLHHRPYISAKDFFNCINAFN